MSILVTNSCCQYLTQNYQHVSCGQSGGGRGTDGATVSRLVSMWILSTHLIHYVQKVNLPSLVKLVEEKLILWFVLHIRGRGTISFKGVTDVEVQSVTEALHYLQKVQLTDGCVSVFEFNWEHYYHKLIKTVDNCFYGRLPWTNRPLEFFALVLF